MTPVFSRLRRGERFAAIGGVILLISMFTSWYGLDVTVPAVGTVHVPTVTTNAWNAFSVVDLLLALTAAVAIGLAYAQAANRAPAIPVALSVAGIWLGAISALVVLFRIIDPPGFGLPSTIAAGVRDQLSVHLSRSVQGGAWVGLVSTVAITAGCSLSLRTEGVRAADERTDVEVVPIGGAAPTAKP